MPVTPNIAMNLPAIGSNNWGGPLNFNFSFLDQVFGGTKAVPALSISGNLTVAGSITAGSFSGLGGATFLTTANYNTANGVPQLNGAGLIPASLLPGNGIATIAFSATPVFNAANANSFKITLTGNVTSSTFANGTQGETTVIFRIVQDSTGGRTFTWPANVRSAPTVNTAPNAVTVAAFALDTDGSLDVISGSGGGGSIPITGTPAVGFVPIATSTSAASWQQLTADDIAPGFTITGFAGGSTVEIGATVTTPAFTASYSSTPASAAITNTDAVDSPLNLTTPFTGGTVVGSFHKTTQASTTFTLTAVSDVTKTSNQAISWLPRVFAGVGAAGASGSVTASGATAVLSNGAVLASEGLSASQVGATYGPFTASGQKVYLLLIGGSHTFKDPSTGFAFPFNTPTSVSFVNANGATVTMDLYESTNTLSSTFSVQVVS